MDGNDITLFVNIFYVADMLDAAGQIPGSVNGNVRIVIESNERYVL